MISPQLMNWIPLVILTTMMLTFGHALPALSMQGPVDESAFLPDAGNVQDDLLEPVDLILVDKTSIISSTPIPAKPSQSPELVPVGTTSS